MLLRQLLTLEQARAKGKLDAEAYRREEDATRDQLKALLIQTESANAPAIAASAAEMSVAGSSAGEASEGTTATNRQAQDTLSGGSA